MSHTLYPSLTFFIKVLHTSLYLPLLYMTLYMTGTPALIKNKNLCQVKFSLTQNFTSEFSLPQVERGQCFSGIAGNVEISSLVEMIGLLHPPVIRDWDIINRYMHVPCV